MGGDLTAVGACANPLDLSNIVNITPQLDHPTHHGQTYLDTNKLLDVLHSRLISVTSSPEIRVLSVLTST